MAVLLDSSAGELVVDLYAEDCPLAAKNFLKLCKIKYYNGCLFYNVQQNFICQTGDPTGTGKGGIALSGLLDSRGAAAFEDEIVQSRKINKVGLVCMAHDLAKENANRSQFFITLRGDDLENLDGKFTVFGEVAEGLEVLQKINELYCDGEGRPYQDVRIKHTYILDDPFADPSGLDALIPPSSPESSIPKDESVKRGIPYEEGVEMKTDSLTEAELELSIRSKEAKSRAIVLEMTGDIPDADVKPPDEVLFVCKLNSVTTDADLELIFSRFGTIKQCDIIKDFKTGDSLSYAFIEFETAGSCIEAYEKMNNVLIDDRRIKVDFSQSVSHLWNRFLAKPRVNKTGSQSSNNAPPVAHHRVANSAPMKAMPRNEEVNNRTGNSTASAASRGDRYEKIPDWNHSAVAGKTRERSPERGSRTRERERSRSRDGRENDYHRNINRHSERGPENPPHRSRVNRSRSRSRSRNESRDYQDKRYSRDESNGTNRGWRNEQERNEQERSRDYRKYEGGDRGRASDSRTSYR